MEVLTNVEVQAFQEDQVQLLIKKFF